MIGIATPLGLATGLAAWLLTGGLSGQARALDAVRGQLVSLRPQRTAAVPSGNGAAALLGTPLFALTTGPGAVREPSIRIDGVAITRRRLAALISIDAKPAAWMQLGETRDGVTLQAVSASGVTVETALGVKALSLGDQSAASAPPPGAPAAIAGATEPSPVPPGAPVPPEPASAPR